MIAPLDLNEIRVLAALIEKAMTTPEYYPLTLNALTAACNQKSNRDPVMQLSEADIASALDSLRDKKLAWTVALAGSRTSKYRHSLSDVLALTPPQTAVLCELMLRGPQTVGELRTRADRMSHFENTAEIQAALDQLSLWEGTPLVARLPRQTGQREERYMHLLAGPLPQQASASMPLPTVVSSPSTSESERLAALEVQVAKLADEIGKLKALIPVLNQEQP